MKPGKAVLLAALGLACAVALAPVHSQGRGGGRGGGSHAGHHHGGGGHHHGGYRHGGGWHGSRVAIGVGFGFPGYWYGGWPYGYYGYGDPYAYYPPVSDAPYVGSFYVEQSPAAGAPQQTGGSFYYYCAASAGYHPYVRQCPGGWERLPATPPG